MSARAPAAAAATSADAVVDRLRAAHGVASDTALATALGVGTSTVRNWRARDSVPYPHCVALATERDVSLDWLLTGREPRRREEVRSEPPPDYAAAATGAALPAARAPPDPRLAALQDWLSAWWAGAGEEERAWLVVELRMLRGRMPRREG